MIQRGKGFMNKTEFRLLREDLHLSQTELAELFGVSLRTFQRWEQGKEKIPEKRIEQLLKLNAAVDFSAEQFERQIIELRKAHGLPEVIALVSYLKQDYDGDIEHFKLHNALLMRCWHKCRAMQLECECRIVLFNPESYFAWLKTDDSQAQRALWASGVISNLPG